MVYKGKRKLGDLFKNRREKGKMGLPTLSVTINDGLVERDSLDRKNETNLSPEEHLLVIKGDIAYNMMRMWQGASGFAYQDGIVSPAYVVLAPQNEIDSLYASYLFKTRRMVYLFWAYSYGITGDRLRLYYNDFAKIPVNIISISRQRKIASLLSTCDRRIDLTKRLLKTKQLLKKGLMQKLLAGDYTFKGFVDKRWQEFRLGELFRERCETNRSDLPLLSITADRGVINRNELDKKDSSNLDKSKYKRIAPGDIGYNTMRMWQGISGVSELDGIVSPAYTICVPSKQIDPYFAGYLFKFPPVINLFYRYSQGLVNDTLNLKFRHFSQIKIKIPTLKEQQKIVHILKKSDQQVYQLSRLLALLTEQKRGLMESLMTVKTSVR